MLSEIYWISTNTTPELAIMARPRAGDWLEDEVAHWKRSGVEVVVSLLEDKEIRDLGLEEEARLCNEMGIEYLSFPIPDRGVPETSDAMRFAAEIVAKNRSTAIHCRAGIGRSAVIASTLLIYCGMEPAAAMAAIQDARRVKIPDTDSQREWIMELPS